MFLVAFSAQHMQHLPHQLSGSLSHPIACVHKCSHKCRSACKDIYHILPSHVWMGTIKQNVSLWALGFSRHSQTTMTTCSCRCQFKTTAKCLGTAAPFHVLFVSHVRPPTKPLTTHFRHPPGQKYLMHPAHPKTSRLPVITYLILDAVMTM